MKSLLLNSVLIYGSLAQSFPPGDLIPGPTTIATGINAGNAVTINCEQDPTCKDALNIFVSVPTVTTLCGVTDGCIKSNQNYGNIAPSDGSSFFPGPYDSLSLDCNGIKSCANSMINIKGDWSGDVVIEATGTASFEGSTLVCEVEAGQRCILMCGSLDAGSCKAVTLVGEVLCIGVSCPIFAPGSDPDAPVVLGLSPNCPDIECLSGTDDKPPSFCRLPGPDGDPAGPITNLIRNATNGDIICSENFDCCLCLLLDCQEPCGSVICGGDESCLANQIAIAGDPVGGANLNCNGDGSCEKTKVTGTNVVGILCDGDISCDSANFTLNQDVDINTKVLSGINYNCNGDGSCQSQILIANNVDSYLCNGDNSCSFTTADIECYSFSGCPLVYSGDNSNEFSDVTVSRASSLDCSGDVACKNTTMSITCVTLGTDVGCPLGCGGDDACPYSVWDVTGASSLRCVGDNSCTGSNFDIDCVSGGCPVSCGGEISCQNVDFDITNAASLSCSGFEVCIDAQMTLTCIMSELGCAVECLGPKACQDADYFITNGGSVFCGGPNACEDIIISFQDTMGGSIQCSGVNGCTNGQFLGITEMAMVSCSGDAACQNAVVTGKDVIGVELSCNGLSNACNGLKFLNLETLPAADGVEIAGGVTQISCKATSSCEAAIILTQCSIITSGCKLLCSNSRACYNLNNGGIYGVFEMECSGVNSCGGGLNRIGLRNQFLQKCAFGACNASSFDFVADPTGTLSVTTLPEFGLLEAPSDEPLVTLIKGISCSGLQSCKDSTFTFTSTQTTQPIDVEKIECSTASSCMGATFIFNGPGVWNVNADTFVCGSTCQINSIIVNGVDITANVPLNYADEDNNTTKQFKNSGIFWFLIIGGVVMFIVVSVFAVKYFKFNKTKQVKMEKDLNDNQKRSKIQTVTPTPDDNMDDNRSTQI